MHKNNMCVIYDTDTKYAMKLMNVINNDKQIPFGAEVFTETEQLVNYLQEYEPKLLMLSEDMCCEDIFGKNSSQLAVLCDDLGKAQRIKKEYGEDVIGVYKYQSSNRILQTMIQKGRNVSENIIIDTKLIGIIGADVCDRNILGLIISYLFGENESVLYVNLDEFSGLERIVPVTTNSNLSDAFYVFKQNGYRYCDEIRQTINHSEYMDYIAPVICADDISYMEPLRIVQLLNCIGQELGYSKIIIDISNGVKNSWHIMESCECVYVPEPHNEWIKRRQQALERYFLETGMEYVINKMIKVPVKLEDGFMKDNFWSALIHSYSTQAIREKIKSQKEKEGI